MANSRSVSEREVLAIPVPEWTDTWHPIGHGDVIRTVSHAIRSIGAEILDRRYSTNGSGSQMFGAWTLNLGDSRMRYQLGIRNAVDKSLALGLCAGTFVLVCSNMAFDGEYVTFRRHTSGLDLQELELLAGRAVSTAIAKMEASAAWQVSLAEKYVPPQDFKALAFDMVTGGVLAPSNLSGFLTAHAEEKKENPYKLALSGATTLYTVHAAATRVMRGWNLLKVANATANLKTVINNYLAAEDCGSL